MSYQFLYVPARALALIAIPKSTLLSLWPNLNRITWPKPDNRATPEIISTYQNAEIMNAHLAMARALRALSQGAA